MTIRTESPMLADQAVEAAATEMWDLLVGPDDEGSYERSLPEVRRYLAAFLAAQDRDALARSIADTPELAGISHDHGTRVHAALLVLAALLGEGGAVPD
jgi:hypothetical protein